MGTHPIFESDFDCLTEMSKDRIESVQIDPVVALRISSCYSEDKAHEGLTIGHLTGYIDQHNRVVEVTHCFETPELEDDDSMEDNTMDYLKYIRDKGCDRLQVGWFTSSLHSEMFNKTFLSALLSFQMSLAESIVLVYDPLKTAQGMLSFRAFPVTLRTSHLANMLIFDLEERNPINAKKTVLEPATSASLERHMKLLDKLVDEVANDSNRFNQYQKMMTKNNQQRQNWITKRKADNDQRRQNGQEELPVDEVVDKMFKTPEAPNRVEPMLRSVQLKEYTDAVSDLAVKSLGKLFITSAFQKST